MEGWGRGGRERESPGGHASQTALFRVKVATTYRPPWRGHAPRIYSPLRRAQASECVREREAPASAQSPTPPFISLGHLVTLRMHSARQHGGTPNWPPGFGQHVRTLQPCPGYSSSSSPDQCRRECVRILVFAHCVCIPRTSCLLVQALISLLDGEGTVLVEAKSHVRSYSGFLHGAISVDSY